MKQNIDHPHAVNPEDSYFYRQLLDSDKYEHWSDELKREVANMQEQGWRISGEWVGKFPTVVMQANRISKGLTELCRVVQDPDGTVHVECNKDLAA